MTILPPDILAAEIYEGAVKLPTGNIPISVEARADATGRVRYGVAKVEPKWYLALSKTIGRAGQETEEFALEGVSPSGKIINAARVELRGHHHGANGAEVQFGAIETEFTFKLDHAVPQPLITRFLRGFQSFVGTETKTPLGKFVAFGQARGAEPDALSGGIQIITPSQAPPPGWFDDASAFLDFMQRGLSLAHGGALLAAFETRVDGTTQRTTFYAGSARQRELATQYHLNLGPFVTALAARFFKPGPAIKDIIWTALSWTHVDTTTDELRFLTAMIAVEALAKSHLLRTGPPFWQRVEDVIAHFGIAKVDFDTKTVQEMCTLRNDIVHDGEIPANIDIWTFIILVRELVTRILLAQVEFNGTYRCYIGGDHQRQFPSCMR